jgi:branched-chain amino acid transport system substrate-binding protein
MLISPQGHLAILAGKECNPNFIYLGTQSDNYAESSGIAMKKAGYKRVYAVSANYAAGKAVMTGFRRYYDLPLAGESWPNFGQTDFAAEIALIRAAKPDAIYVFLPGGMGMGFLRQYAQSGLMKDIPHVAGWAAYDPSILDAVGADAIGATGSTDWALNLDNPANRKFVADFTSTYKRSPSHYAAASYDVAMLLDAGIKAVNGKVEDKPAFSKALRTVAFNSVRGPDFKINLVNGFPIANHYSSKVVKGEDGKLRLEAGELVVAGMKDPYVAECPAK